jgi:hypothetical protein
MNGPITFDNVTVYDTHKLRVAYGLAVLAASIAIDPDTGKAALAKAQELAELLGLPKLQPEDDAWPTLRALIDEMVEDAKEVEGQ